MNLRLQQAISRFDLGAYLDEQFVDIRYAAGGEEYRLQCFSPNGCAGGDYKHKLYVNVEKKRWICFKCGYGTKDQPGTGFLIRFMADVEGLHPAVIRNRLLNMVEPTPEDDLNDLIRNMFTQVDGGLTGTEEVEVKEPDPIKMPREFRHLEMSDRGLTSAPYRNYLKGRGLKEADGRMWDIRFCPTSFNQWTGRIVFPIIDEQGAYRSAVGRALKLNSRTEKWVNWPDTELAHFLWPMHSHPRGPMYWGPKALLVEGIFDALAAIRMRPSDMIVRCSFGKKISDRQVDTLKQHGVKDLILAWDPKEKPAMKNAAERLTNEGFDVSVFGYRRGNWGRYDIGDGLCNSWVAKAFRDEIRNPIPFESPEFLSWLIN
jgi:hypothetical protein